MFVFFVFLLDPEIVCENTQLSKGSLCDITQGTNRGLYVTSLLFSSLLVVTLSPIETASYVPFQTLGSISFSSSRL